MKKPVIVLLHLGYWLVYTLLISFVLLMFWSIEAAHSGHTINQSDLNSIEVKREVRWLFAFFAMPAVIGFYSFYTFLFSFLNRKKIIELFLYGITIALISGVIANIILLSVFFKMAFVNQLQFIGTSTIFAIIALLNGILSLLIKGFITWYGDIKLKEELSRKNYEMELALVKAHINPHFLFNTINNIDVLIQKNAIKASEYLNKLSDIMRFMLYETKTEKIPLSKELSYIEKYIELQKIRTSNPDYVKHSVNGNTEGHTIAPMLFIPFIENAFKHAENKKIENAIRIDFDIKQDQIIFECENSFSETPQLKPEYGGLGNELIRKRLLLLYPEQHHLEIINNNGTYKVTLTIKA